MPKQTKTSAAVKLYVSTPIAPRWRKEISADNFAQFFSPYVTGEISHHVLLASESGNVELYTSFLAEFFASRASSLACLESLMEYGITVYHLPNLHAKMLLISGKSLTIGSQNLTSQGTKNREANVFITNENLVSQAENEIREWLVDRELVSNEMIAEMKEAIIPLKRKFKAAQRAADCIDERIREEQKSRVERAQAEAEERTRQERLRNLSQSLSSIRTASHTVYARMQRIHTSRTAFTDTLTATNDSTLTHWYFNGQSVELKDCYRYLCVIEDTGALGWARVSSTRISFVSDSVLHGERVTFQDRSWSVTFKGSWSEIAERKDNLTIEMKSHLNEEFHISYWFAGSGTLLFESVKWVIPTEEKGLQNVALLFSANTDGIADKLGKLLMEPFKFRDGDKLAGRKANEYFGAVGSKFRIRLGQIGDHVILLAKQGWF